MRIHSDNIIDRAKTTLSHDLISVISISTYFTYQFTAQNAPKLSKQIYSVPNHTWWSSGGRRIQVK